jgi:hypothetical protein
VELFPYRDSAGSNFALQKKKISARKRGFGEIWHRLAQMCFREREKEKKQYLMVLDGSFCGEVRTATLPQ